MMLLVTMKAGYMMASEAQKRAQKKYDLAHKEEVTRIDIKIPTARYTKELAFLKSLKSRQYFIMWLVKEFLNNEELQKKWENTEEKDGK